MMKNWKRGRNAPDWILVQRLISIGDEASVAVTADVAAAEATLYAAHVRSLIESISG
jgi:hypothetical protein